MSAASAIAIGKANSGSAKSCGRSRNFLRHMPRVMQTARGLFPIKTAAQLSDLTKNPVRTWEYWLSKERMDGEALAALIASPHGMAIVDAIAGESPWWRQVREALALADKRHHALQEAASALRTLTETSESFRVPNTGRAVDSAVDRGRMGRVAPKRK
ncbi:MAG: hypothetical protein IT562_10735 [Alphaproteobacteria bacterium]|nr:hypothetical protein [Alphaproteobacteria bacterium]